MLVSTSPSATWSSSTGQSRSQIPKIFAGRPSPRWRQSFCPLLALILILCHETQSWRSCSLWDENENSRILAEGLQSSNVSHTRMGSEQEWGEPQPNFHAQSLFTEKEEFGSSPLVTSSAVPHPDRAWVTASHWAQLWQNILAAER